MGTEQPEWARVGMHTEFWKEGIGPLDSIKCQEVFEWLSDW
jgi:hypothetical protein